MTPKHAVCREIETDLIAAATGEAAPPAARRVDDHVGTCAPCRREFEGYRAIEGVVGTLRRAPAPAADEERARTALQARLADVRSRLVRYGVFASPLGRIMIGLSEQGVALVEYLEPGEGVEASRLRRLGVEAEEGGGEVAALHRELLEYLGGRRTRLDWPLDMRLARGDFDRAVLRATAAVPYGSVTSYAGIASEIGAPKAVRAVAQALRWNPVPIVVPCHRIVGSSGGLTGYAGPRLDLKERLLSVEGVPTVHQRTPRIARRSMYHLAHGEHEYCVPTCGDIATQPIGRVTLYGSRTQAEAVGLTPCTSCRPDLHPLAS